MEIIKKYHSEMKNTLSEMKSILAGINRVDKTADIEDGEANGPKHTQHLSLIHI